VCGDDDDDNNGTRLQRCFNNFHLEEEVFRCTRMFLHFQQCRQQSVPETLAYFVICWQVEFI